MDISTLDHGSTIRLKGLPREAVPPFPGGHFSGSEYTAVTQYALATGEAAAHRLHVLHDVYGPGTRRRFATQGCAPDASGRPACGGIVTAVLPRSSVRRRGRGVDFSGAQIAGSTQIKTASRTSNSSKERRRTGFRGSFDLVYPRFLLIHLPEPGTLVKCHARQTGFWCARTAI
jgi:hypothetical protein